MTVRFVPDIVIHTLRVTLLSDSGYALIGYEYCARIMWFDDCRFAFEPVSAPRSLTNTQGMQKNGNDSNLLIVFYVQIMPDDFVMQLHRF